MRVGLVVNRVEDYVLPVATGMTEVLRAAGASVLVLVLPPVSPSAQPWLRRVVRAGTLDAVAVTAVVDPETGESCAGDLVAQADGVPVVTLGCGDQGVPDVSCDNASAAAAAAAHLLSQGRRRPLVVAGIVDNPDGIAREVAFTAECVRLGLPREAVRLVRADFSRELAYRRTLRLLHQVDADGADPVDAVFAANDDMAFGVLDALRVQGLRTPQDVAVVGFDNTAAAETSSPGVTSLDQHLVEQGRCAARLLLGRLAGRAIPRRVRTRARLVVRASSTADLAPTPATDRGRHATETELSRLRELLVLNQGLLGVADDFELASELAALLPRTALRRTFVARTRRGQATLLHAQDGRGTAADDGCAYPPEALLPAARSQDLDHGTLVVHLLTDRGKETGLLVYEQDQEDRWSGQALQQLLTGSLASLSRSEQLIEHAAGLERVVAARTGQLRQANERLQAALLVDGLTGLQNRVAFDRALERAWSEHRRSGEALSVLMCDVDHFKSYNDVAGHLAGDDCLRAVAACLADAVRGGRDVVARFGGEEFAVLLPGTDAVGAATVAERVLARVRAAEVPHLGGPPGRRVSLSIGYAASARPTRLADPATLVDMADQALYRAKAGGRDRTAGTEDVRETAGSQRR